MAGFLLYRIHSISGTIEENTEDMSTYYRCILLAGPSEKGQELLSKVNAGEELTLSLIHISGHGEAARIQGVPGKADGETEGGGLIWNLS